MVVLENIVNTVNSFLWDFFLLFALVGTGMWLTFKTKGIQIRYFTQGFKQLCGNIKLSGIDSIASVSKKIVPNKKSI